MRRNASACEALKPSATAIETDLVFQLVSNHRKAYPLIEPSVIPLTNSRIEKVKSTMTGMLAIA
jgi:hypothetical protein